METQINAVKPYDKHRAEGALIRQAAGLAEDAGRELAGIRDAVRVQEASGARQHLRSILIIAHTSIYGNNH